MGEVILVYFDQCVYALRACGSKDSFVKKTTRILGNAYQINSLARRCPHHHRVKSVWAMFRSRTAVSPEPAQPGSARPNYAARSPPPPCGHSRKTACEIPAIAEDLGAL
ncbi:hypothetical protein N9L68_05450 [bacterium]|nr:hypothetical protein [bacterium]